MDFGKVKIMGEIFLLILGIILLALGAWMILYDILLMKTCQCYEGQVCDISDGYYGSKGATVHHVLVKFVLLGKEITVETHAVFTIRAFFDSFRERELSRLRKKYIGKQVHIYYNPDKPLQSLVREFLWRDVLISLFPIALSGFLIFAVASMMLG